MKKTVKIPEHKREAVIAFFNVLEERRKEATKRILKRTKDMREKLMKDNLAQ